MDRVILHCDMNNFYASVECLYNPDIRSLPVAVCGDPEARHGIILAKNMLAKAKGVKTGETIWQAKQKCPSLHLITPSFLRYQRFSHMANELYARFTDRVEPFGIDESWLDLTGCVPSFEKGVETAHRIRAMVEEELGVTVSVGVSFNKVFAKLGSDLKKPNAVTVISRDAFKEVLFPLGCEELLFVGRATRARLHRVNIRTIGDIAQTPPQALHRLLGKWGVTLHRFANGLDQSPVMRYGEAVLCKGVGNSTTLPFDIMTMQKAKPVVYMLSESISERMRAQKLWGQTLSVWVRYADLSGEIHQVGLPFSLHNSAQMAAFALSLLGVRWSGRPVRSLGVRMTALTGIDQGRQLSLFEQESERMTALDFCVDSLRSRFGHDCIARAVCLSEPELYINPIEDNTIHPVPFNKQTGRKEVRHA